MYIILACKLQCLYSQDCILIWIYRTQINYITLPLVSVPAVTPEGAATCRLDRLDEEHVGAAMTAD